MAHNPNQKASADEKARRFWDLFWDKEAKYVAVKDRRGWCIDDLGKSPRTIFIGDDLGRGGRMHFNDPYYHPDPLWKQHCVEVIGAEIDAFWEEAKEKNLLLTDIKTRLDAYTNKFKAMLAAKDAFSDQASHINNVEANDNDMNEDNDEEAKDAATNVNDNEVNDNMRKKNEQDTEDEDHNEANKCESADDGGEAIDNDEVKYNEMDNDEPSDVFVNNDENRVDCVDSSLHLMEEGMKE